MARQAEVTVEGATGIALVNTTAADAQGQGKTLAGKRANQDQQITGLKSSSPLLLHSKPAGSKPTLAPQRFAIPGLVEITPKSIQGM